MYSCDRVKIKKAEGTELKKFCDMVGLVVLNADGEQYDAAKSGEITYIVESASSDTPVGCCRIDEFTEGRCSLNYYLCKPYEYDEEHFADMIFAAMRAVFNEFDVNKVVCKPVKKMFPRQRFFPEAGFVIEVLYGCVNPNGEYLVDANYVIYREEFEKRYGN